jgi:hypothetical protein
MGRLNIPPSHPPESWDLDPGIPQLGKQKVLYKQRTWFLILLTYIFYWKIVKA